MWFQNSTPQSVGAYIAMQEARKASKRQSAHGSDMEPSTKKQKFVHQYLPPAPAQPQAHASTYSEPTGERPKLVDASLAPAQVQAHASTYLRPTDERPKLVDSSMAPAQVQAQVMTNLGPNSKKRKLGHGSVAPARGHDVANHELATQKSNLDHGSLPPAQALAHAHDITDLGPATKKQKLSYATLPPARVRVRISSEDYARVEAEYYRRRLRRWCKSYGFDYSLLDQSRLPDTLLMSPTFDVYKYMVTQSSKVLSRACGPQESDVFPFNDSPGEASMAESQKLDAHRTPERELRALAYHLPASDTAAQVRPISGEVSIHHSAAQNPISRGHPGSGDETSHSPLIQNTTAKASLAFGEKFNEACPPLEDQTSKSLSSIDSTFKSPLCSFSDLNVGCNTTPMRSDQIAPVGSDRDMGDETAIASSNEIAPLSLDSDLGDETTPASLSQSNSVGPPRNKGGRPRSGKKPRAPKKPKGPTRFQKNHPVKAMVNVYVWENILMFCPPEFLLKARWISSTFRSVLKDDSPIWKKARLNHFGPDMPDPPLGLSEPQYADLVTGTGCQTRGCTSTKTRKTYWALQKRLCIDCFNRSFLPPRALRRVFKELETSQTPQYNSIARYYRRMDEFLPGMKFDRWDNYQWLGDYHPTPSWGQFYRSGQYTGYPAVAYANFNSELAVLVGNEYDVEHGRFFSKTPMPGKTCPPQDAIDAWFEAKRAANHALVAELQAVENWCESLKRDNQKVGKDLRKNRESFYEEQAELAGWNKDALQHFKSYQAAIAISKPATMQSWKILQPKIMAECEKATKTLLAEQEAERMEHSMEDTQYDTQYQEDEILLNECLSEPMTRNSPLLMLDSDR